MSTLNYQEKRKLETLFGMRTGYVLSYSDRTFGDLFDDVVHIDIHSDRYCTEGTSKAKKFRAFWAMESDAMVGTVLREIVAEAKRGSRIEDRELVEECEAIANRLLAGGPDLSGLAAVVPRVDARYVLQQIRRMEEAVEADPDLAIGTAKELIETCCKTILEDRSESFPKDADIPQLTKMVFKELNLTRDDIPDSLEGAVIVKRVLSNLGSLSNDLARLRNIYGTGHGKTADAAGLSPRHARLAVGSAAALVRFLFESHTDKLGLEASSVDSRQVRF